MHEVNSQRIRLLRDGNNIKGSVIYWMSRDQRVHDNWALLFAQNLAKENNSELAVVFNLVPDFLEATIRQYGFMLKGLEQLEKELKKYNIPFYLFQGKPEETISKFIKEFNISIIVSDFDPLRIKRIWKRELAKKIDIPFYEVDTHNIVPCMYVSQKVEFGAYTIRPKINRALSEFLVEFPRLSKMQNPKSLSVKSINWTNIKKALNIDFSVPEVNWITPGEKEAKKFLRNFINKKMDNYIEQRNDPTKNSQSDLSPYLHFGQISAQRVALEVQKLRDHSNSTEAFLEELIVRRELSDNYCYYNSKYDSFEGFPHWAKKTLNDHKKDKREFIYSLKQFEKAETHEDLWNAAQKQLSKTGKLHGYMRMYWAKKILEWSKPPEEALKIAIYLNDKYELDGRDPNGYVGCAWSIGGVHDRAWKEREVFGKIRYMNYSGSKRKFDVDTYINKWNS
jgi:deoxyribodipyrimidine photo-lyase